MHDSLNIWSAIAFWLVLIGGYRAVFELYYWLKKNRSQAEAMTGYFVSLLVVTMMVIAVSKWHWAMPAKREAKAEFYGAPIVCEVQSIEGKVFTPQAFVVTENRILVYDKDNKVYALDGIKLDGLKPEQLAVGSNITYTVYQKGGQLLFGKM